MKQLNNESVLIIPLISTEIMGPIPLRSIIPPMSVVKGKEVLTHGDDYYYDAADGQLYPGISHVARRAQATDDAREAEARLNQTHYSQGDANAELAMVVGFCALTATPLAIALYSQNHQAFDPLIERVMSFFGG